MSLPRHLPVLHSLEEFLKGDSESVLQFSLMRNEKGEIVLHTFEMSGDGTFIPTEPESPTGDKEVGETLRLIGRRIVRQGENDGRRAA